MAAKETEILNRWRLKYAKWAILFKNNTGTFLTLDGKRKVRAGLGAGTSDMIGFKTITITESDVGRKIAVFTAVEAKTPDGVLSGEQRHFLQTVRLAGGIALVIRSENDDPEKYHA